jgi:flagellar motor switch protein FliG
MTASTAGLAGVEKAAVLLISLGADVAAEVFKYLSPGEVEMLARQIVRTKKVDTEVKQAVVEEFARVCDSGVLGPAGGADYAREVLQQALGAQRGLEMIDWITGGRTRPFEWLKERDPAQIFEFIQNEHPQTIALILSNLPSQKAATVLSRLSPEQQSDVAVRVVTMDATTSEVATQIEDVLRDKFCSIENEQSYAPTGGAEALAEMLNNANRSTEKAILESLAKEDPALADEIKQLMFVFDDIVRLDDRSIQLIIREVESDDLRLALKGVNDIVRTAIFRNMSERAAETLKEDLDLSGAVRVRDVETAQQKIMTVIHELEEKGDLVLRRTAEDALIE